MLRLGRMLRHCSILVRHVLSVFRKQQYNLLKDKLNHGIKKHSYFIKIAEKALFFSFIEQKFPFLQTVASAKIESTIMNHTDTKYDRPHIPEVAPTVHDITRRQCRAGCTRLILWHYVSGNRWIYTQILRSVGAAVKYA